MNLMAHTGTNDCFKYSGFAKFRRLILTLPVFLILIILALYYEVSLWRTILVGGVFLMLNFWLDYRQLQWYSPVIADAEKLSNEIAVVRWDAIVQTSEFGPRIENSWSTLSHKFFYQSGIVLLGAENQLVVFSNIGDFDRFQQLIVDRVGTKGHRSQSG